MREKSTNWKRLKGKNPEGKNFRKLLRRKQSSAKISKISRNTLKSSKSEIWETFWNIFCEHFFLPRSFQKFLPFAFLPSGSFRTKLESKRRWRFRLEVGKTTPKINTIAQWCPLTYVRRSVMSIKFPPAILGRRWLRQFYGRLAFFGCFCWQKPPHAHKIPPFGGGGVLGFFFKGGWVEVLILFLWAWGFWR